MDQYREGSAGTGGTPDRVRVIQTVPGRGNVYSPAFPPAAVRPCRAGYGADSPTQVASGKETGGLCEGLMQMASGGGRGV